MKWGNITSGNSNNLLLKESFKIVLCSLIQAILEHVYKLIHPCKRIYSNGLFYSSRFYIKYQTKDKMEIEKFQTRAIDFAAIILKPECNSSL